MHFPHQGRKPGKLGNPRPADDGFVAEFDFFNSSRLFKEP
jgi:hypothetical protein